VKPLHTIAFVALALLPSCSTSSETKVAEEAKANTYNHQGVAIHFKDIGRGRPIVFIHGFGASIDTWRFIVDDLKDDYRLVLLDLKGHGYSDRPRDSRYSLADHAAAVLGLMDHLGLSNAVLVGHSLGSAIALLVALRAQETSAGKVSGTIVIAGSLNPEQLPVFLRLLRFPVFGWLVMKLTTASFRTRLALRKSVYDKERITDSWIELYAKYQRMPGTDYALLTTAEQMVPHDASQLKDEVRKLKVPVLNILGEHDEVISKESGEGVCKVLPQCSMAIVDGVGHIPHEEKPENVIPLLKDFIRGLS
jgi:pimeloyl-ACP methyl ester carboxylesterase